MSNIGGTRSHAQTVRRRLCGARDFCAARPPVGFVRRERSDTRCRYFTRKFQAFAIISGRVTTDESDEIENEETVIGVRFPRYQ